MWEAGNLRIHQVPNTDRFVIQDGTGYLPGSYASFEAAAEAFGFSRKLLEELQAIQDEATGGKSGVISLEDLESAQELAERLRPAAIRYVLSLPLRSNVQVGSDVTHCGSG
jgi:hypothetical protein